MPRFFFHVCNGAGFAEDEEGLSLPDVEAARAEALKSARALLADDMQQDGTLDLTSFIEVEDERRQHLFKLVFRDAVRIVAEPDRP